MKCVKKILEREFTELTFDLQKFATGPKLTKDDDGYYLITSVTDLKTFIADLLNNKNENFI